MRIIVLTLLLVLPGWAAPITRVLNRKAPVKTESIALPGLVTRAQYSLLYSVSPLTALTPDARITVEVFQGTAKLAGKVLHAGDPDYYTQFSVPQAGPARVSVKVQGATGTATVEVNRWPFSAQVRSNPAHRWQDARTIPLGKTIFASGDDAPYIPLPGAARRAVVDDPTFTDWYKFEFAGGAPKLVYFQVDLMERDQLPVNITVHKLAAGKLEEYFEGEDPVALPHEVQALPGNKFTPRLLKERGTFYVAVRANHPEYKLRTRVYDPPPYTDPHRAVRIAMDYVLAAGDSWHGNTPRRGGLLDRVSSVHQETSLCVGCHVTHFPLRAALYAVRNGYPVVDRQPLQFLVERFYNNPRPFYGFENQATWARVISAPANVLGRMSHLTDIFEEQISGERRDPFHKGIQAYLNLYYAGRDKLPPDETNGNTPLVSAHEIAWYAWTSTRDSRLPGMIAAGEIKNMVDLCYQTLALADIDRDKYKDQIHKNAERILSLQRPDGQWAMRFAANEPEAEFQTGHALWALHAAGIPAAEPHVARALQYLLSRQQPYGAWMDPRQSYENFRTPFRESQMAILALSAYYPETGRARGWNAAPVAQLSQEPVEMLEQLDNVWDPPSETLRKQIETAAGSPDALVRQAAVEALGRAGKPSPLLGKLLGDPSKMVQRTAAWALRQTYSRQPSTPLDAVVSALASPDDRTRWGATRVFSQHFATLAARPEIAAALMGRIDDAAVTVRMGAVKGLWQAWFWSADTLAKSKIEDTVLTAMAKPQPAWVTSNLRDAVYNLADENIRYLYNNWVALLGNPQDRDRAIKARLAVESRLASKFVPILEHGPVLQKKELLTALTELPLRRGDVYDLEANIAQPGPPVYSRIGNDIEQTAFFGETRDRMAAALLPLLDSSDAELRRVASKAVLLVRDAPFAEVNRIAGTGGAPTRQLLTKVNQVPEAAEVARALRPGPPGGGAAQRAASPGGAARPARVDEAWFRAYIEPILQKRGRDGYACVHCHASHTLFDGTWSTVRNVIDGGDPENSLILRKPTSTSESEGVVNSAILSHGGGVRFTKGSPEYNAILEWIKGAKD